MTEKQPKIERNQSERIEDHLKATLNPESWHFLAFSAKVMHQNLLFFGQLLLRPFLVLNEPKIGFFAPRSWRTT